MRFQTVLSSLKGTSQHGRLEKQCFKFQSFSKIQWFFWFMFKKTDQKYEHIEDYSVIYCNIFHINNKGELYIIKILHRALMLSLVNFR